MNQIINIILNEIFGNSTCISNDLLILSMMFIPGIYVSDRELNLIKMSNNWSSAEYPVLKSINNEFIYNSLSELFFNIFNKCSIGQAIALVAVTKSINSDEEEIKLFSPLIILTKEDFDYVLKLLNASLESYNSKNNISEVKSIILRFSISNIGDEFEYLSNEK